MISHLFKGNNQMDDPRQQHGNHTWDIIIEYLCCPKCNYINENREPYEYRLGKYQKGVICSHCKQPFTVIKRKQKSFDPL